MGLKRLPRVELRLTAARARQQAFELMGPNKVIRRRADGKLYIITRFDPGTDYDTVTLDPGASPTDDITDVDW